MLKKRIVPEHEETYKVCDECKDEITDYSSMQVLNKDEPDKHFHDMHAGGTKGEVKLTCFGKYNKRL